MAKKKKSNRGSTAAGKAAGVNTKQNKHSPATQARLPNYMSPTKSSTSRKSPPKGSTPRNLAPPKRIFLIRHGESMGQAANRLGMDRKRDARLLDCGLTPKGVNQAEQLSRQEGLVDSVDVVVSSPLTRAIHTALLGFPNHPTVIIHGGLAELGSRVPENKRRPIRDVQKSLKFYLEGRRLDTQTFGSDEDAATDYEPRSNMAIELGRVMREDIAGLEGDTVAIVCHYCIIQTLLRGEDVRPRNALPIECILDSQGRLRLAGDDGASPMEIG